MIITKKLVLNLIILSIFAWSNAAQSGSDSTLQVGQLAPTFFAKSLAEQDFFLSRFFGSKVPLERRAPLVLSFFTTFCIPCRQEISFLETLQQQYPDLPIFLVNISEGPDLVKTYIQKMGFSLPVLLDRYGQIAAKYRATTTPFLVIIGTDGKLVYVKQGFTETDKASLRAILKKLWHSPNPPE